jgi:hypothetical protein
VLDRQGPTGGQGVAGSNPVVPTAVGSPLFLVIIPGQRAFLIPRIGLVVDLGCRGMGTICGPSVDTARFSRGDDHKSKRDCTCWQTSDGGQALPVYIEVPIRGDNSGIPGGEDFLYVLDPRRQLRHSGR